MELLARGAAYRDYMTPDELAEERERARAEGRVVRTPWRDANGGPMDPDRPHVVRLRAPQSGETRIDDQVKGEVVFRLVTSNDPKLNWKLAETLEVELAEDEAPLKRKNGDAIEKSLFEKVFRRDFNELEKDTAWYLDGKDCVHWWHRIAVAQASYGLQGWQKNRVYPDFLACIHGTEGGKFRFTVLETKGEHLKGNDDTAYKQKLFDILTEYATTAMRAGELVIGTESEQLSFTMLMSDSWKQSLDAMIDPATASNGKR